MRFKQCVFLILVLLILLIIGCTANDTTSAEPLAYEFELEDMNGQWHKLSDYQGKPVFIRIWSSNCDISVYKNADLEWLTAEAEDFVILTAVMPTVNDEKTREEFTDWYIKTGFQHLNVLFDDQAQLYSDFNIKNLPAQLIFDADGQLVYGVHGLMSIKNIIGMMSQLS